MIEACGADAWTTVGTGADALGFYVRYVSAANGRAIWRYTVTNDHSLVIAHGTDLSTPDYQGSRAALESLLVFAGAASDQRSGAGDCGFPAEAVEAFAVIADELALAGENA